MNQLNSRQLEIFRQTDDTNDSIFALAGLIPNAATLTVSEFLRAVNALMAKLDQAITAQINEIIHHEVFQHLEAVWRGTSLLVNTKADTDEIKIKILNASWDDLKRDMTKSMEFDQSTLFDKVYSDEFGSPGGEPYGLMIGDYYANLQGIGSRDDLAALKDVAEIMAASFCPFVMSVTAQSFELDSYASACSFANIDDVFKQAKYSRWQELRKIPEARFVSLMLPRALTRAPYNSETIKIGHYCFQEQIETYEDYCWGNASFVLGATIIKNQRKNNWPVARDNTITYKNTDARSNGNMKFLELEFDAVDNSELATNGLVTIQAHDTEFTIIEPVSIFNVDDQDSVDVKIASKLNLLCLCRFAHHIKLLGRDLVGKLYSPEACQAYFSKWIIKYTASNEIAEQTRFQYPLEDAQVMVTQSESQPGVYKCTMYLKPRLYLEKVSNALALVTELTNFDL